MSTQVQLEAAVFRRLVEHFREHTEIQNIDVMDTAGFCRNCLAKWYVAASEETDSPIDYEEARKLIYGMSYGEWKSKYQK